MKLSRIGTFVSMMVCFGLVSSAFAAPATQPTTQSSKEPILINAKVPATFVEHNYSEATCTIKTPKEFDVGALSGNMKLNIMRPGPDVLNVNVVEIPPQKGLTLAIMKETAPPQVAAAAKSKLIVNELVTLPNYEALRVSFDQEIRGLNLRKTQYMILRESGCYFLTFTGLEANVAKDAAIIEQIAVSAKFPK